MKNEQKMTIRFYNSDPIHKQALEILQLRTALFKKSYGDTIAAAIVGYYGGSHSTDDELADNIVNRIAALLSGSQSALPTPSQVPEMTAPGSEDIDIDWSFLGG